ncbi:50S ribosomal protein L19 [Candidatus Shikimatogenerans bostrichidophilus]|uniref:50S ribosomal protein L19 n=1 Tax=Candidatus Shikimatogenerans bostrichidophilus TaxID=2943807 RepID=UPI0029674597
MKNNSNNIIKMLEKELIKNKNKHYKFNVGDNITVYYYSTINKKNKKKILFFTGYVISKKGNNKFNKTFIIRNTIYNIGVEITFFLYSPYIKNIKINKKGKVRKSKIYYIRKYNFNKIKNLKINRNLNKI